MILLIISSLNMQIWYLITSLDDYSRLILYAVLVERETTWTNIITLKVVILGYVVPYSYYVDSYSVFHIILISLHIFLLNSRQLLRFNTTFQYFAGQTKWYISTDTLCALWTYSLKLIYLSSTFIPFYTFSFISVSYGEFESRMELNNSFFL